MHRQPRIFAGVSALLATALLAAGCRESAAPAPANTRPPALTPALDVVGDQRNGTFGASGTAILKGFNPTNPHLGDAIIATFFWVGSSNIITSVSDHLTDGTPVGNTYTLVEYITAGGISMATYIATNVQNFPDPNPDQNKVLVVQANLSTAITTGGIVISAYSGVQTVTAQALGAHRSASGSGSSTTTADPGSIAINANALAYGVTLSNGVVGVEPPPGFINVSTLSDASMKADGEYAIQGGAAGTVDPRWTWFFNQPSTWLASVLSLNAAGAGPGNQSPTAAFTSSCNALACNLTSTSSDPDGSISAYSWTFGDGGTSAAQNPSHTYASAGTYTVSLTVTDNQGATGTVSHSVTVSPANQSPVAAFTSSCSGLTCVFTSTSSDPDGSIASYSWNFGDGGTSTAQNPSHTYASGNTYTVALTVTDNQGATNSTTRSVTVSPANQAPTANFTFSCSALSCNFTSTSSDPDGSIASYSWTFGDGGTSTAQNPSHTYGAGGTYTAALTVTDNQGATNSTSRSVTVSPANQLPTANFTFSCSALACSFTSTSSDPDGSIATYSWNFGDGATSTAQNPSHSYGAGGSYTVTLKVTDNQGAQSPTTSKTLTVTAPNQPPTANFTFSCSALACNFTSTSSDPDGSIASYSWTFGDGGTSSAQSPSHSYGAGGSYTVTLKVTDNQGTQSPTTSKTVTVTAPNQPPTATFTASCSALSCNFTSTSSDPDGSLASYSWNFGDGATSAAQNPSHAYGAGGTYTVSLQVTDNQGAKNTTSKSVTLTAPNQPPAVNAGPDETAITGLLYSLRATFSDPNNDGPWSYTIAWGDGSTSTGSVSSQGSINVGHTYVIILPKSFTITVTVRDSHGASASDTKVVSVVLL